MGKIKTFDNFRCNHKYLVTYLCKFVLSQSCLSSCLEYSFGS